MISGSRPCVSMCQSDAKSSKLSVLNAAMPRSRRSRRASSVTSSAMGVSCNEQGCLPRSFHVPCFTVSGFGENIFDDAEAGCFAKKGEYLPRIALLRSQSHTFSTA
eukprot:GFKZ01013759.1.p2 GENE.GFKZ01013759.1~~GFKZ01013759.1.p2  ORF type:complete len:106 (-),score=3.50 GFKZ01013759.1:2305-2622(-)